MTEDGYWHCYCCYCSNCWKCLALTLFASRSKIKGKLKSNRRSRRKILLDVHRQGVIDFDQELHQLTSAKLRVVCVREVMTVESVPTSWDDSMRCDNVALDTNEGRKG